MSEKYSLVLVVDDDPTSVLISSFIVKHLGITEKIEAVNNGKEGLASLMNYLDQKVSAAKPVLVLLDLMMPVMDGFEFLGEFSKVQPKDDINVCVLSSSSQPKDKAKVKELGASFYLEKPLTEEKLMSVIV
jgi:CheY-like chemotaxis protein